MNARIHYATSHAVLWIMAIVTVFHTGSNVARANKARGGSLPLQRPVKGKLGGNRNRHRNGNNWKILKSVERNVRTLLDRASSNRPEHQTALVAKELSRYNIDNAALCETRLANSDSTIDNGNKFFWGGRPKTENRDSGVGFAIKNSIVPNLKQDLSPIIDRMMIMRLPFQDKGFVTIITIYAPTITNSGEAKERFYSDSKETIKNVAITDKLAIAGNFYARVGTEAKHWPSVTGTQGTGKCNSNGELF